MSHERKGDDTIRTRWCDCKNCKFNDWHKHCTHENIHVVEPQDEGPCPLFALYKFGEFRQMRCWNCKRENSHLRNFPEMFYCKECQKFFKNGEVMEWINIEIPTKEVWNDKH
jgi:hypothetical protein